MARARFIAAVTLKITRGRSSIQLCRISLRMTSSISARTRGSALRHLARHQRRNTREYVRFARRVRIYAESSGCVGSPLLAISPSDISLSLVQRQRLRSPAGETIGRFVRRYSLEMHAGHKFFVPDRGATPAALRNN